MNNRVIWYFVLLQVFAAAEAFTWRSCGSPTDPIKVSTLAGYLNESRTLILSGTGKVAYNVTSPIQAMLTVRKKFFWGWTTIPCVNGVGSCDYDDVCSLSPYVNSTCPEEFINNQLPCTCPVTQGQYAVKKFPVNLNVLPGWIEDGSYMVNITLVKDDKRLICLLVTETLKKNGRNRFFQPISSSADLTYRNRKLSTEPDRQQPQKWPTHREE